jgi:hypothetical protein
MVILPEPQWQPFTSRDGWFQAEFPNQPTSTAIAPSFAGPNAQMETAGLDKYGEDYRIIYWNVPPLQRLVRTDEALMQREVDRLMADLRQAQIVQPPRPVPGQPHLTYELQWLDKGNRLHIARLVLAGERFYLLLVQARFFWVEPDLERVERFFQSFRVRRLQAREPANPQLPPLPANTDKTNTKPQGKNN